MKLSTLILAVLFFNQLIGQQLTDTLIFRDSNNYRIAVDYYLNQIQNNEKGSYNYYQAACYYSLTKNLDSAFEYLSIAINKGAIGENVLTDTDFNTLKNDLERWSDIDSLLKIQYLEKNLEITKPELGYELWLMWVEDQRYRTLWKNYKLKEKPEKISMKPHYARVERLNEIIKNSGWPKYSEIGKEGGDAVFYVFQHNYPKDMKRLLPIFIEAGKQKEADLGKAAMMIDRYLAFTKGFQIYGSQAHGKRKKGMEFEDIKFELYPIADEENMIRRREALGMAEFYSNCERLKVKYIPIENRTDYLPIEINKKWIKKGYLLVE